MKHTNLIEEPNPSISLPQIEIIEKKLHDLDGKIISLLNEMKNERKMVGGAIGEELDQMIAIATAIKEGNW